MATEAGQPPAHTADSYVSEELTLVWLLLITTVVITYFIQRHRLTWIPPSSCAMILGVLAGVVMRVAGLASSPLRFSPAAFFYALLPPIIFAAGFTLKKRQFFKNFFSILMFAVVGTFISAMVFGGLTYLLVLVGVVKRQHLAGSPLVECLAYGAAISSIDPVATLAVLNELEVPPLLYNLVFGESVLNDAVAIVLFRSLAQFSGKAFGWSTLPQLALHFVVLSLGSLAVGAGIALLCAFILKRFYRPEGERRGDHETHHTDGTLYEIAIVVMGAYLAYLVAEVVEMSGVVALFFSGICHAHYSCYNVSPEAQVTLRKAFDFAAFMCEQFVFLYLGIQVVTMQHSWDAGLLLSGIPLCVLSRAANIFPCSYLANLGRTYPIPPNLQKMLWAVGLRGAVAYGLVINLPRADKPEETGIPAIETATLFIVVVTTLVLGSATGPLLRRFDLEGKDDAALYGMALSEGGLTRGINPGRPANRIELSERSSLLDQFKTFDAAFLKPLFGGRTEGSEELGRLFGGTRSETARSYVSLSFGEDGNGGEGHFEHHSRLTSPTFTRQPAAVDHNVSVQLQRPGPANPMAQLPTQPGSTPGAGMDGAAEVQLQSVGATQQAGGDADGSILKPS